MIPFGLDLRAGFRLIGCGFLTNDNIIAESYSEWYVFLACL